MQARSSAPHWAAFSGAITRPIGFDAHPPAQLTLQSLRLPSAIPAPRAGLVVAYGANRLREVYECARLSLPQGADSLNVTLRMDLGHDKPPAVVSEDNLGKVRILRLEKLLASTRATLTARIAASIESTIREDDAWAYSKARLHELVGNYPVLLDALAQLPELASVHAIVWRTFAPGIPLWQLAAIYRTDAITHAVIGGMPECRVILPVLQPDR
ncbi:MAG: hypothetical protein ACYC9L_02885 [Sulfuricaulis sp.]